MVFNGLTGIEMGFYRDLLTGFDETTMGNIMGILWDIIGFTLC
jgi:hypothetical protein